MHLDCRHGQDDLLKFKLSIRMGKKEVTLNVALLLEPDGQKWLIVRDFQAQPFSRVYREWSEKRKYQVSGSSLGKNVLLIPEFR